MENSFAITTTFIAYLIMMLAIGVIAYKRTSNSTDYFLGGRSLGPWPAALSAGASDMSGWLLLGLPGYAYAAGFEAFWLAGGLLVGTWANWLISAKRLRTYSITTESLTLPEFLSRRFNDNSKLIQTISAFFILLFFLFYTSSGLVAGGKLFETVFGLDYTTAVIIGTVCVVSYTLFGGFLAVSWTDLVQGLLMSAALLIVPIAAMNGGLGQLSSDLHNINPELLTLWNDAKGEPLSAIAIISLAAWGLGYFGQPHILARFKATRSNKDLTTARRIAVIWTALSMVGAMLVGLVGLIYVTNSGAPKLDDGEKIFMLLVNAMFHPVIAGILLAAILAAIMSTADSQLLVSSSAMAEDLYKQVLKKDATSEEIVRVGRFAVILISLIALVLAMTPDSSVLGLVSYAWAGFGAAFGPAIVLSLYWSRMNRNGALAGIVVGGVTIVLWKQFTGGWFDVYEIVPGIILSTLSIVIVSLITGEPEDEVKKQHAEFEKNLVELD
ncbi:sodium/proline symporter PutP [Vibrio cyclitrophicus]|uniref:Sodium/proline symporter n=1 Tax=Vibrio cyclitrophicus TaxID=47951 RepID=A0A7Z1S0X1_9VIBR|nr:proline:sodium symporter PutP [Vibrio lentus]NOH17645.1 sodium/proline symporter PutP [Vibrio cyclitrophicus]OED70943.1 sodium/proline symporter [Vibrio cyclitrophicus ZF99]OED77141.1 sodium/proline symporter [Vibrio cyclitrophicus ZF65]OED87644.1 sodium/proline symporter [Vibrio cyclitrophicus ZF30]OEE02382.1 sodium/proline symporter [Vibrio cyclitrophicus ZF28]OEE03826.1 sodium/proline symporter [Vibrio cyclitrophicus ZF270]OEE17946.1 sodium/proline symporter [Vibrio cyclitrophicus ZF20